MISDSDLFGPLKIEPYRNRSFLDLARNQRCVRCGCANAGEIVMAHFHGKWSHLFGHGSGVKGDDHVAAMLCMGCHSDFDSKTIAAGGWLNEDERALEFMICVARTWRVLIHQGKLILAINNKRGIKI